MAVGYAFGEVSESQGLIIDIHQYYFIYDTYEMYDMTNQRILKYIMERIGSNFSNRKCNAFHITCVYLRFLVEVVFVGF